MHEYTWWYLYIQILNHENERRREVHKLIESLLPWLNLELWQEIQKDKDKGRTNVDYEKQLRAMLDGSWSSDPNDIQMPQMDDLQSSRTGQRAPQQGTVQQVFEQAAGRSGSIKDTLFPNAPPTFSGAPGDIPPEYRDFYKNLPNVEDFPPEEE